MITFEELNIPYLPSGRLWSKFAPPLAFGPGGNAEISQSGNPSFGFFDNFHSFQNTTLEGPYRFYAAAGCAVAQIADTATEKGLLQLSLDGNLANDDVGLQWGRGLGAPFQLANNDLVFECRLSFSNVATALHSFAIGLAAVGAGVTDGLLVDTTGIIVDTPFLGFHRASTAAAGVSASYKATGQAVQNGSTNTRLLNVATLVANTYVKLGFRFRAAPRTVEWFVDGNLAGTSSAPARLTASQVNAATFPSTTLMAPVIALKDIAGTTVQNVKVDWIACAQNL